MNFKTVLYLDDMRVPTIFGIDHVWDYAGFVAHIEAKGVPEFISFDHDLNPEHYPFNEDRLGKKIPYETYKEKTGLHAARYLIENKLPLRYWAVHSFNAEGRKNIETELRAYCPRGEVKGVNIPYRIVERPPR